MGEVYEIHVTMPDGSVYAIPTYIIGNNHAEHYKEEYGGDVMRSMQEGTLPLFEENGDEVIDWAKNNMDWEDVREYARLIKPADDVDFENAWCNAEMTVVKTIEGFNTPEGRYDVAFSTKDIISQMHHKIACLNLEILQSEIAIQEEKKKEIDEDEKEDNISYYKLEIRKFLMRKRVAIATLKHLMEKK